MNLKPKSFTRILKPQISKFVLARPLALTSKPGELFANPYVLKGSIDHIIKYFNFSLHARRALRKSEKN